MKFNEIDLNTWLKGSDNETCEARWEKFVSLLDSYKIDFELCEKARNEIFQKRGAAHTSKPIWIPSNQRRNESNLFKHMTRLGLNTIPQFHHWSVANRFDFWDLVIDELDIIFKSEFDETFLVDPDGVETWLPDATLNIVESCFQANRSQLAVISGTANGSINHHSYEELFCRVNQVANSFRSRNYVPGDRIGIVLPLTFESIAAYLGLILAGCVPVLIADSFSPSEIKKRLELSGAKSVVTYEQITRSGKSIRLGDRVRESTNLPIDFLVDRTDLASSEFSRMIDQQSNQFETEGYSSQAFLSILFSSGTTGDPKAIPWNQTVPIKCASDAYFHHDIHAGDIIAWPTSLGWMMGPWLIFAALLNRGTIAIYEDAPTGESFGKFIESANVNILGLVPSMVRNWRATKCIENCDWSCVRTFSSTGEASHPDDMAYLSWLANYKPIIEYCGGTEIGGGYISSTVVEENIPSAFTTPAFGLDFEIRDSEFKAADQGEVFLIGPSIGLSNTLLNRDHFETYFAGCPIGQNGSLLRRHGDFFQRINYRCFIAGGRADDTMNLGGVKVSSIEIENILKSIEGVADVAAVAVPYDRFGPDQLYVFVVREKQFDKPKDIIPNDATSNSENSNIDWMDQMNQAIKTQLNPLFRIAKVIECELLPRTSSNKIMRRKLRDQISLG